MEDLNINEQSIVKMAEATKIHIVNTQRLMDELLDKKTDLFIRHMNFHKLGTFNKIVPPLMTSTNNLMSAGHNIGHPFLQTKEAKECGWMERTLENDPFFESPNSKSEEKGVEDFLRLLLSEED